LPRVLGRQGGFVDLRVEGLNGLMVAMKSAGDPKVLNRIRGRATLASARVTGKVAKALAPIASDRSVQKGAIRKRLKNAIRVGNTRKDKQKSVVTISAGKNRADTRGAYYRWIVVRGTRGVRDTQRRERQSFYGPLIAQGVRRNSRYKMAQNAGLFGKIQVKPIAPRPFIDVAAFLTRRRASDAYTEVYRKFLNDYVSKARRK
jgi:hypothetical protein